jgi:hypothetical protein
MKASRRAGSARPSSFLAFFHDRPSRCSAARTVSRQHGRANRTRTKPTSRRSVQRGFGSAPATGGPAASRCAAQTAAPSAAWISGQRGDGLPCADTAPPRGRLRCSGAATPSRSAGAGRCARPLRSRNLLARSRARPESARGCAHGRHSGPSRADPPRSDPNVHGQHATPRQTPHRRKTVIWQPPPPLQAP